MGGQTIINALKDKHRLLADRIRKLRRHPSIGLRKCQGLYSSNTLGALYQAVPPIIRNENKSGLVSTARLLDVLRMLPGKAIHFVIMHRLAGE